MRKNIFKNILEQVQIKNKEIEIGKPILFEREDGSEFRLNPYLEANGEPVKEKIKMGDHIKEVAKYRYFDERKNTQNSLGTDLCLNLNPDILKNNRQYIANELLSIEKVDKLKENAINYIDLIENPKKGTKSQSMLVNGIQKIEKISHMNQEKIENRRKEDFE